MPNPLVDAASPFLLEKPRILLNLFKFVVLSFAHS